MGNLLITTKDINPIELTQESMTASDFLVFYNDFKDENVNTLAHFSYLHFVQENTPLYFYRNVKGNSVLDNTHRYVNLGLLNDDNIKRSDSRLLPKDKVFYTTEMIQEIIKREVKAKNNKFSIQ